MPGRHSALRWLLFAFIVASGKQVYALKEASGHEMFNYHYLIGSMRIPYIHNVKACIAAHNANA